MSLLQESLKVIPGAPRITLGAGAGIQLLQRITATRPASGEGQAWCGESRID